MLTIFPAFASTSTSVMFRVPGLEITKDQTRWPLLVLNLGAFDRAIWYLLERDFLLRSPLLWPEPRGALGSARPEPPKTRPRKGPSHNVLFAGGRDIVGDTTAMAYVGLQVLTKW